MNQRFGSIILDTAFRILIPFIILYGVYVLFHGKLSPGGGFQGGALLAITVILARLVQGEKASFNISGNAAVILAGIGTLIYAVIGVISFMTGGSFLDYGALPLGIAEVDRHFAGILGIEIGVTICVMGTIIAIYDALTKRSELS